MKYNIITLEREYASGGSAIGESAAQMLGIPCYGKEILQRVAKRYEVLPEQLVRLEEAATNSLLFSLVMSTKIAMGERSGLSDEGALYLAEARIIYEMAEEGSCVIVGHCANHVLRDRKDVLNVFIQSDMESRTRRAIEEYGERKENINSLLKKCDKRRSNYYTGNSGCKWDGREGYHLVLDSGQLGVEKCAAIICEAAR